MAGTILKEKMENSSESTVTDPKQLSMIYKKNGTFDQQRKCLLENFRQSETHTNLLLKLKLMVSNTVKQDPSILLKNRGKMGALIQGNIINQHMKNKEDSSLLSIVDKDIQDKIIDSPEFHNTLKGELKDIKRRLLGISDEEYRAQLEEEEAKEKEKRENEATRQTTHGERDYKNNFKIKHLSNHRVSKPPRFNFNGSTSYKAFNSNNDYGKGNDSGDNDDKKKKNTFLTY